MIYLSSDRSDVMFHYLLAYMCYSPDTIYCSPTTIRTLSSKISWNTVSSLRTNQNARLRNWRECVSSTWCTFSDLQCESAGTPWEIVATFYSFDTTRSILGWLRLLATGLSADWGYPQQANTHLKQTDLWHLQNKTYILSTRLDMSYGYQYYVHLSMSNTTGQFLFWLEWFSRSFHIVIVLEE